MDEPKYPFVYFDLGNVLVHFDPEIACRQVAEALHSDSATIRNAMYESGLETQLEDGSLSEADFLESLFRSVGTSAPAETIIEAMSAMFWVNITIVPAIARLIGAGVKTGILSNTCAPHWNWIARQNFGIVRTVGEPFVLSYEVGSMKPDHSIYSYATERAGFAPDKILFIDDREENVAAAMDFGWHAIQYSNATSLISELRKAGMNCFT